MNNTRPYTLLFAAMSAVAATLLAYVLAAGRMHPMFAAFHDSLLILFVPIICLLVCGLLLFRGSRLARYGLAFMFGVKAVSLFGISALDFTKYGTPFAVLAPTLLMAATLLFMTALLLFSRQLGLELRCARERARSQLHQRPTYASTACFSARDR